MTLTTKRDRMTSLRTEKQRSRLTVATSLSSASYASRRRRRMNQISTLLACAHENGWQHSVCRHDDKGTSFLKGRLSTAHPRASSSNPATRYILTRFGRQPHCRPRPIADTQDAWHNFSPESRGTTRLATTTYSILVLNMLLPTTYSILVLNML
jgi:hypothetical protein